MERAMMKALLGVIVAAGMPAALAQTGKYPERPIRLISPFPPGGTVDVNARILAPAVAKSIGQQVVVDNRAGASGIIGTAAAAREAGRLNAHPQHHPDGDEYAHVQQGAVQRAQGL